MREIKFRVWDFKAKRFVQDAINDVFITLDFKTGIGWFDKSLGFIAKDVEKADLDGVQQFTGIKDKTGREIYEGDIVKYTYQTYSNEVESGIGEVFFEEGIFYFDREMYFAANDTNFGLDSLEVIGNIFEHPELLEKSAKTAR